jgi:peptidoglycan/xylan/chitin deacetylase (PgdA/CDA1 family)
VLIMAGAALTKRILFLCISIFVFSWSILLKGIRRLLGKQPCGSCVVLYYHEVRPEYRRHFARQMDLLRQYSTPIRADRKEPLTRGRHYVAVTFDDGYKNVIDNAVPELETRNIPATLFIITDAYGKYPDWLTDANSSTRREPVVSEEELQNLSANLISVGSHTLAHPNLPTLKEADAKREIVESRSKLEKTLKRSIRLFSFPYGAYNADTVEWCRQAGYERVFTTSPTWAFVNPQEFVTGRVPVEPSDLPLEFRMKLMGAYRWLPLAISVKRKMQRFLRPPKVQKTQVLLTSGESFSRPQE